MKSAWVGIGLVLLATVVSCAKKPEAIPVCTPENSPYAICGMMNPEDLARLPGRTWIVVSQMAQHGKAAEAAKPPAHAGTLLALRPSDLTRQTLYPAEDGWPLESDKLRTNRAPWGHPDCSGPPNAAYFQPHGIDVGRHASGADMLAVVNHGGREAVELFEINPDGSPTLDWRGCVRLPAGMMANDVALLSDGGFVVTKFLPTIEGLGVRAIWTGLKIMAGWNTGGVYRWSPGKEVELIDASGGSAPNGIVVGPDERYAYVAEWGETRVYRVALDPEDSSDWAVAKLDHAPDNLTWTSDGKLLVAGQGSGIRGALGCSEIQRGGCALDFGVYSIDPDTMQARLLFTGKGAASVALEFDDEVLVGSFVGDKIERFRRTK